MKKARPQQKLGAFLGAASRWLVEPRGIEPLSENPSTQLSPSAVCLLKFPRGSADKQAQPLGSLWYNPRYKAICTNRSLLVDAAFPTAVLREATAARLGSC